MSKSKKNGKDVITIIKEPSVQVDTPPDEPAPAAVEEPQPQEETKEPKPRGRQASSKEGALQRVLTFLKPSTVDLLKKDKRPISTVIRELVETNYEH